MNKGRLGSSIEEFFEAMGEAEEVELLTHRKMLIELLRVRAAAFVRCIVCGKLVAFWEVTNRHAASWECLDCADMTDAILLDDEWWRSRLRFKAALDRVPDVAPDPGDEKPGELIDGD